MKFLRENAVFLILLMLAIVLIYFALSLEMSIAGRSASGGSGQSFWDRFRQQMATLIRPAAEVQSGTQPTTVNPPATATPALLVIAAAPTPTPQPIVPPTPLPPVPTSTATALPNPPTSTVAAPVDLRIGYVQRARDCTAMTEIITLFLQERFGLTVVTQQFADPTTLFNALAAQEVDITLCYTDPEDRTLMRDHLGLIRQIGVQHFVGDGYKLQIWANGNSKATLRNDRRCVLDFLEKVDFTGQDPQGEAAAIWLQKQQALVTSWSTCPF